MEYIKKEIYLQSINYLFYYKININYNKILNIKLLFRSL